jgi:hypothetical protein
MGNVVKGMDVAMKTMDLEKVPSYTFTERQELMGTIDLSHHG